MAHIPLAEKLRPTSLNEVIGQPHLIGPKGFLTRIIKRGTPLSILLWGPPGCGKTSIARLYAKAFDLRFTGLSAVWDGIADLRRIIKEAQENPLLQKGLVIFVDEMHRFNKAQQDAFLPFVENGTITLVGSTVENPSFYLNNALLSRLRVLTLNPLNFGELEQLLIRAESATGPLPLSLEARTYLIEISQGDGRYLINMVEQLQGIEGKNLTIEELQNQIQKRAAHFDKAGEYHYNLISALHKAVRGSDPQAALYWYARMLEGGEDPLFIARRVIRMASEDIGLADPQGLPLSVAARDTYEMLGSPEGELAIAEAIVYLSLAPKSNALYTAYQAARKTASETTHYPPPKIILNPVTRIMREAGYGKGYIYDHDTPEAFSGQNYFPDELQRQEFYNPVERGFERDLLKRIEYFSKLRLRKSKSSQ